MSAQTFGNVDGVCMMAEFAINEFDLSNGIVDSAGYRDAFRSQGRQPVLVASVFDWAMTSQAMLYNLTKPLLRAE